MDNIPESTDLLADRLRVAMLRRAGLTHEIAWGDLTPNLRESFRDTALVVYEVLGVENVNHALASQDNIANARRADGIRERIREHDTPAMTPLEHMDHVFGGAEQKEEVPDDD